MPSRRRVLRAAGAAAAGAVAGCAAFDAGDAGDAGYVQLKSVAGWSGGGGRRVEEDVLRVALGSPPGSAPPELTHLDDEWAHGFATPRTPVVSDALHDDLRLAYGDVRYVVGVCSPAWGDGESVGCYNVATTRENFNRVQVGDRVTASSDGTTLAVHSVDGAWNFE